MFDSSHNLRTLAEFYNTIFSYSCRAFVWWRHVVAVKQFYGGLGDVEGKAYWGWEVLQHLHPRFIMQFIWFLQFFSFAMDVLFSIHTRNPLKRTSNTLLV